MSNSSILDDLRWWAETATGADEIKAESNLKTFAAGLIGYAISPPCQPTVEALAVPAVALAGNPPTLQTFELWVETLGDLYRAEYPLDCVEWSPHVAQILNARSLLDDFRAFMAVAAEWSKPEVVTTPCLFPQPLFEDLDPLGTATGHRGASVFDLRDEFYLLNDCGCLDAPLWLPQGSTDTMRFGNHINAFTCLRRE